MPMHMSCRSRDMKSSSALALAYRQMKLDPSSIAAPAISSLPVSCDQAAISKGDMTLAGCETSSLLAAQAQRYLCTLTTGRWLVSWQSAASLLQRRGGHSLQEWNHVDRLAQPRLRTCMSHPPWWEVRSEADLVSLQCPDVQQCHLERKLSSGKCKV